MADRDDNRGPGGPSRGWPLSMPLRKVPLRRVVPWRTGTQTLATTAPRRTGAAVVDCALYVGGTRQAGPGPTGYAPALAQARETDNAFVWLGLHEPTDVELADVARVFDLHELAVEDALTPNHRAKIERYGDVVFFVLRTTRYVEHSELTETSEVVETGAIMVFVGPQFVVTVRHGSPGALGELRADLEKRPDLLAKGPWQVAHAICDRLVDTYLDVSSAVENDMDALEEHVFGSDGHSRVARIYQLKRELMEFRRAVAPLQRPLAALVEDREFVPKEIRRYFRDVNDNLLRVVDRVASYDDLLNSILQARLAQVTVDQNNDMRKIAAWAAIAAVQTAIAGIYGMNFENMPELEWKYGYFAVVGLIAAICALLYRRFRKVGWL